MASDDWTEKKCHELIRQYRKRPMLWDQKNINYYRKDAKPQAWVEIGEEMGIAPENCKRKISILMSSFRREKVKYLQNLQFGKYPFIPFHSTWFAFDAMSFLLDKDRERKRNVMNWTDTDDSDENTDEEYKTSTINTTTHLQNEDEAIRFTARPALLVAKPPKTYSRLSNRASNPKPTCIKEEQQSPTTSQPNEDEIKYFSNFIASKMMKYSETTKNAVQQAICDIIFKADQQFYEQNQESNESNLPSMIESIKEEQTTSSDVSFKEYFSDGE